MAFIYWAEPFETKDLDVFTVLPLTSAGLIHLAPIWDYLVSGGATPEGQFIRASGDCCSAHGLEDRWQRYKEMYDVDLG